MRPEFFVDRSLGRHGVSAVLIAAGWTVTTHFEVYGDRDERVSDVEWLEHCAAHELVVLSKDRRLRYRPDEIGAIRRLRIRAFVLARGSLTGVIQAQRFLDNEAEMRRHLIAPGPCVCVVYASGVERVFP